MKGRRPKPELATRPTYDEPSRRPVDLVPPQWLDDAALSEWRRVLPLLDIVTERDVTALASYCQCYSDYIKCVADVAENGIRTDKGLNPAMRFADTLQKQLRAWCVEFGCTPTSRGRMQLAPTDAEKGDDLAEFLS